MGPKYVILSIEYLFKPNLYGLGLCLSDCLFCLICYIAMLQINFLYSFNYFTISGSCYTEGSDSQGYG